MVRLHLFLFGRVQGVGFRWLVRDKAQSLNLTGWVKNMPNGSVEVVVEGLEPYLRDFLRWWYNKPKGVNISRIEEDWQEATREYNSFDIRHND